MSGISADRIDKQMGIGIEMTKSSGCSIRLEELNVEELITLRENADRLLGEKLSSEKRALRDKLSAIERYEREATDRNPAADGRGHFRRVPPKYRDPQTGATWAGRGQMPRWMTRRVEQGAKPEDFLINDRVR